MYIKAIKAIKQAKHDEKKKIKKHHLMCFAIKSCYI